MATGLIYPPDFLSSLKPLLDRPFPFPPVRALSDIQFAQLHAKHLLQMAQPGIANVLFPYLHGVEHGGSNMREYFCRSSTLSACIYHSRANPSNAGEGGGYHPCPPSCSHQINSPDYRGLIWVSDDGIDDAFLEDDGLEDEMLVDEDELDFSRPSDASLQSSPSGYSLLRTSTVSSSSAASLASRTVTSLRTTISDESTMTDTLFTTSTTSRISGTFKVSELLSSDNRFLVPRTPETVSLRNFDIQVAAYARISDIVVYGNRAGGVTRSLIHLANRFSEAHELLYQERVSNRVAGDMPPFYNVFVLDCPPSQLPRHLLTPCPSFAELEQIEMHKFTTASEILPGIFLGNSADVPTWSNSECTTDVFESKNNPSGYDLVVECVDSKLVSIPSSSHIKKAEDHLATLQSLWATGFMSTPPQRPAPNAHSVLHLVFPCSPPLQAPLQHFAAFISFIQSLIHPSYSNRRCKILIYSQDGYTDTSVLALTLLMAEKKCSLSEAYLELQIKRMRSFFVHSTDLPLLQKLQTKYYNTSSHGTFGRTSLSWVKSRDKDRERWLWSGFGKGDRSSSPEKESGGSLALRFGKRSGSLSSQPNVVGVGNWFQHPKFDGSLPSRILPFLYLGNLNHAVNAHLLHALGITHVVSVGESALIPPDDPSMGHGSLWLEEREGRIKVLDVKNILDDGMDGLSAQFGRICDWIDQVRTSRGRVLVHCRVGVSRSATVTIAYVMRYMSLPLIEAYLLVRSRRLSVLIQPNIRLLFDLLGWEIQIARERLGETTVASHIDSMEQDGVLLHPGDESVAKALCQALCWPFLAREIYRLNSKYIR